MLLKASSEVAIEPQSVKHTKSFVCPIKVLQNFLFIIYLWIFIILCMYIIFTYIYIVLFVYFICIYVCVYM